MNLHLRMGTALILGVLAGVLALGTALAIVPTWGWAAVAVCFIVGLIAAPSTVD